jgi:hypothetical protein
VVKSEIMKWTGHVTHIGEKRGFCGNLKQSPWPKGDDNIGMDLKEIGCEAVKLVYLVQTGATDLLL